MTSVCVLSLVLETKKENEFFVLLSYKVFNFTFPETLDTYPSIFLVKHLWYNEEIRIQKGETMSFDGFFLHHLTKELKESLLYGRIQKVNQPFERELVLTIRNHRQNYKLLLSAHPVLEGYKSPKQTFKTPKSQIPLP